MKLFDGVQGSDEWHAFRLEHFGASEAAAMLGLSKKVKRTELLHMKHTGIAKEFSDWVQENILDNGHRVEAMARPIAEEIIGEELFPATYYDGKLSASSDGLTMLGTVAFEHKQWNAELASSIKAGILPEEHAPQCQQVMMVTGARRLLFMVSDGTKDNCEHLWVEPDAKWIKRILQGWTQFAIDLANYKPAEEAVPPTAAAIESLPALLVQVEGRVLATNLDQFKQTALTFINNIKTDLSTDQDFADADKMTKFLKDGEEKLELVKSQTLAQTASIYELFRTIDTLRDEMRVKRLTLEKTVTSRKAAIRAEIQAEGEQAAREHINKLNMLLGKPYMPDRKWTDFVGAMRAKKSVASLRDAVSTELARFKIEADEVYGRIQTNLNSLREMAADYAFLFADTAQIVLKQNDDLVALVKLRIAEHKEAEAKRTERERIDNERADALAVQAGVSAPAAAAAIQASGAGAPQATNPALVKREYQMPQTSCLDDGSAKGDVSVIVRRPTDDDIIAVLAMHYHVHESTVIGWLLDMDLPAASQRMTSEVMAGSRK